MSPEQTRGKAVDARTDLGSMGVVLYEMLAGERPFRGGNDASLIHAIRHDAPNPVEAVRPEVPPALAAIVRRCLEKDPDARYRRADDLLADLRAAAAGGTGATEAVGERRRAVAGRARWIRSPCWRSRRPRAAAFPWPRAWIWRGDWGSAACCTGR